MSYAQCSPEVQEGLRKARAEEWKKWMKFNAAKLLSEKEAKELFDLGLKAMPMQWVESDKNYHKRREDKDVEMLLKSRLVGCGNF